MPRKGRASSDGKDKEGLEPWAYRGVAVLYPGDDVFEGKACYQVSQLPMEIYLKFQPEMQLLR